MQVFLKRIGFWTAALAALLAIALPAPAGAVDDDPGGTFLTAFPDNDVYQVLTLRGSLDARNLLGGTAPAQVRAQLARHRARLAS
jgi:hypothetical protein